MGRKYGNTTYSRAVEKLDWGWAGGVMRKAKVINTAPYISLTTSRNSHSDNALQEQPCGRLSMNTFRKH